jgi:hypothetical protein
MGFSGGGGGGGGGSLTVEKTGGTPSTPSVTVVQVEGYTDNGGGNVTVLPQIGATNELRFEATYTKLFSPDHGAGFIAGDATTPGNTVLSAGTPGALSGVGLDIRVGDDSVGLMVSEKDATTIQLYDDQGGAYDLELVDQSTFHWKHVSAAGDASIPALGILRKLAAAPGSPVEGESYYDTVLHEERVWNGSAWVASSPASGGTPAIVLGTAAAAGSAGTFLRDDDTIVAFDATAPTTSAIGDAAAVGSAAVASRRDHKHGREALSTATPIVASAAGATGTGAKSSREDHSHPDNPMTTKGDVILGDTAGVATRLAAGTSAYVLTSNGAAAFPSWQAGGGGGISSLAWIDNKALDVTYGADWSQASGLPTGWSRHNLTSGNEKYQQLDGNFMELDFDAVHSDEGYLLAVPGSWTGNEFFVGLQEAGSTAASRTDMIGFCILDSSGNGNGIIHYQSDGNVYKVTITAYQYVAFQAVMSYYGGIRALLGGQLVRYGIRKVSSSSYLYWFSPDGIGRSEFLTTGDSTTYANFYIGRVLNSASDDVIRIRRTNKF